MVAGVTLKTSLNDELVVTQVRKHAADRRALNAGSDSLIGDHASLDEEVILLEVIVNGIYVVGMAI